MTPLSKHYVCHRILSLLKGMQAFPDAVFIAGDNFDAAPPRTLKNADFSREKVGKNYFLDALRWDARSLPLRPELVDAVVTDLVCYVLRNRGNIRTVV